MPDDLDAQEVLGRAQVAHLEGGGELLLDAVHKRTRGSGKEEVVDVDDEEADLLTVPEDVEASLCIEAHKPELVELVVERLVPRATSLLEAIDRLLESPAVALPDVDTGRGKHVQRL